MNKQENKASSMAGGIFIAIGMLAGAIVGVTINQPSAGMIVGLGLGIAVAVVIWLVDSKRK